MTGGTNKDARRRKNCCVHMWLTREIFVVDAGEMGYWDIGLGKVENEMGKDDLSAHCHEEEVQTNVSASVDIEEEEGSFAP